MIDELTLTTLNFYLSKNTHLLFVKHKLGINYIYMPSFFFWKKTKIAYQFCFINKIFYKKFLTFFFLMLKTSIFFFGKLKIKGLGYYIDSISDNIHYFFFNYTNFIFFFNPLSFIVKTRKKKMLLVSNNWQRLKLIIAHILLLKKIGPYTLRGLRLVKHMIILKKRQKKI